MPKQKIPAVQVLKSKSMFGDWPIKIGGVQVGSVSVSMRTGAKRSQVSLITDQYTTHAMSDPCVQGGRDEVKAVVEKWLREYVFTPDSTCKKVRPWGGWDGPWIKGTPKSVGKFFVVFADAPHSVSTTDVDDDNLEYLTKIIAHTPVTIPQSPFKNVSFT